MRLLTYINCIPNVYTAYIVLFCYLLRKYLVLFERRRHSFWFGKFVIANYKRNIFLFPLPFYFHFTSIPFVMVDIYSTFCCFPIFLLLLLALHPTLLLLEQEEGNKQPPFRFLSLSSTVFPL